MNKIKEFYTRYKKIILIVGLLLMVILLLMPIVTTRRVKEGNAYYSKKDVALYIYSFEELPKNFITKAEAEDIYGNYANAIKEMKNIGGDSYKYEGVITSYKLPSYVKLQEADIYKNRSGQRGEWRLVYTTNLANVQVYFSDNHYGSFSKVTNWQMQSARNVFLIIFFVYTASFIAAFILLEKSNIRFFFRRITQRLARK